MSRGRDAHRVGQTWELRAAEFLEAQGVTVIARGYRCRLGEIDIIGSEQGSLVIVEVRARQSGSRGSAVETVGPMKRQRIIRATRHFLMRHPSFNARPIRFDVVAIDGIERADPCVTWVRHAFDAT